MDTLHEDLYVFPRGSDFGESLGYLGTVFVSEMAIQPRDFVSVIIRS
jgi:hypothetical protein